MRLLTALVLLAALTSACGAEDDPKAESSKAPTSAPATAAAKGIAETCEALANSLGSDFDSYDQAAMAGFVNDLADINNAGDGASREMLRPLADPSVALANGEGVEAHMEFLNALDDVAAECSANGSTALE
jgi:hypothetical protein